MGTNNFCKFIQGPFKKSSGNNSLIDECTKHLEKQEKSFEYIFCGRTFNVTMTPIREYILDGVSAEISRHSGIIIVSAEVCLRSLAIQLMDSDLKGKYLFSYLNRYDPSFAASSASNPGFFLYLQDHCVKVVATTGSEDDAILAELYNNCADCHLTGEICSKVALELAYDSQMSDFHPKPKPKTKEQIEKYIACYLNALEDVFYNMTYRIHFHPNPKYECKDGCNLYIGFADMSDGNYTIRESKDCETHDDGNDRIIAKYSSARDLLLDGWELD